MSNQEFNPSPDDPPEKRVPPVSLSAKGNGEDKPAETSAKPLKDEDGGDAAPEVDARPPNGKGPTPDAAAAPTPTPEELDEDAAEFARLRRDLPNASGAAALGITSISVVKAPPKNEFFRSMKGFRPIVDLVIDQVRLTRSSTRSIRAWPRCSRRSASPMRPIRFTSSSQPRALSASFRFVAPTATATATSTPPPKSLLFAKRKTSGCASTPTWRTVAIASSPRQRSGSLSRCGRSFRPLKSFVCASAIAAI